MKDLLLVIQIIAAIVLTIFILVQVKGTGFGRVWGSSQASFSRRGLEKLVFRLTFVVSGVFILASLLAFIA